MHKGGNFLSDYGVAVSHGVGDPARPGAEGERPPWLSGSNSSYRASPGLGLRTDRPRVRDHLPILAHREHGSGQLRHVRRAVHLLACSGDRAALLAVRDHRPCSGGDRRRAHVPGGPQAGPQDLARVDDPEHRGSQPLVREPFARQVRRLHQDSFPAFGGSTIRSTWAGSTSAPRACGSSASWSWS